MNGYQRIMNAIDGKPVDRTPVWPFVMQFAAKYAGVPYSQYASNYREMARALIRTAEDFDLDAITVDSDAYREACAYGAKIEYPPNDLPIVKKHAIIDRSKFTFQLPKFEESERLIDKVEGVRMVKQHFKGEKAVAGWIEAPLQSAGMLYSMDDFLTDLYEEPGFIQDLVASTTELGIQFAGEQIKAGADVIGIGDAMASLVSPKLYEEFFLPNTKRLVSEIKSKYDVKLKYHICGRATHLLPYVNEIGFDIVNIDYLVDAKTAMDIVHGEVCIKGNVNPTLLQDGTVDEIKRAARELLQIGNPYFILSPGCEVTRDTPAEHIHALVKCANDGVNRAL